MIRVTALRHVGGYRIELAFSDGSKGVADLEAELQRRPRFAALVDVDAFGRAFLEGGTVCWPGGLDLAPERLYALTHGLPVPDTLEQAEANEAEVARRGLTVR